MGAIDQKIRLQFENIGRQANCDVKTLLSVQEMILTRQAFAQQYINTDKTNTQMIKACIQGINYCDQRIILALAINTEPITLPQDGL
jgi:hypothetical protein